VLPSELEILPFKIELFSVAGRLQARASSMAGAATAPVVIDEPESVPERPAAWGQRLYRGLFKGDVGVGFKAVRLAAKQRGVLVALQLEFDPTAVGLAQQPWELLNDGDELLLSGVALSRHLASDAPVVQRTFRRPLHMLVAAPSPAGIPALHSGALLPPLGGAPGVSAELLQPATFHGLLSRLATGAQRPQIFDFEGHGDVMDGEGGVFFEAPDGSPEFVSARMLAMALGSASTQVSLAVIDACHGADAQGLSVLSSVAARLVSTGIPAVLGMSGRITNSSAKTFFHGFYERFLAGAPLIGAVDYGRQLIFGAGEWHKPVVYLRSTDVSGGRLLPETAPAETLEVAPRDLYDAMLDSFGPQDLKVLCFRLGVRLANLPSTSLASLLIDLIEEFQRTDRYSDLVKYVLAERPHLRQRLTRAT